MEQVPSGIPDQVRSYLFRQLSKLENMLLTKDELPKLTALPSKPLIGKVYYFSNVIGTTITSEGAWIYTSTGWQLLSNPALTLYSASFATNWSDYGGVYTGVQYCKTNDGIVHLFGLAKRTGTAAVDETILTLPTGFRPSAVELFMCAGPSGYTNTRRVDIKADGTVIYKVAETVSFLSLSGISFKAA